MPRTARRLRPARGNADPRVRGRHVRGAATHRQDASICPPSSCSRRRRGQDGRAVEQLPRAGGQARQSRCPPSRCTSSRPTTRTSRRGQTIRMPKSYAGKVVYEGELGIVIGKTCRAVSEAEAQRHIFGYTCINDVTAAETPQPGRDLRAVDARQELRHLRRVRPGDRDRPRSDDAVGPDRPQRPGAAELSGVRHGLPAGHGW